MPKFSIYRIFTFLFFFVIASPQAQNKKTTPKGNMRGSITKERVWWDVLKNDIKISVYPSTKSILGKNTITYKVLNRDTLLQFELQSPLQILEIIQDDTKLTYTKHGDSYIVHLKKRAEKESEQQISILYTGSPREAKKAPWDGGILWKLDNDNIPFIATANQEIGASVWWPCKDHPYDEADTTKISITVPKKLTAVSNGKKIGFKQNENNTNTHTWLVTNPINNYGVSLNIANYSFFKNTYNGLNGELVCNYYVLPQNYTIAKKHFSQVHKTLEAFEYWFGPYPFYEDTYKLEWNIRVALPTEINI
ncbi:hypothetical protein N9901_03635 [Flavobacteriaceae bacterium]|nr:hypothetical protein [Flavobacteriaceae bacterium]